MKSVLKEFYYGNIQPGSKGFKRDSEYARTIAKLSKLVDELLAELGAQNKGKFMEIDDLKDNLASLSCLDNFIDGYRLGVLMTVEVFIGQ